MKHLKNNPFSHINLFFTHNDIYPMGTWIRGYKYHHNPTPISKHHFQIKQTQTKITSLNSTGSQGWDPWEKSLRLLFKQPLLPASDIPQGTSEPCAAMDEADSSHNNWINRGQAFGGIGAMHLAMITHGRRRMAKLQKIRQVTFGVTTGCKKTIQLGPFPFVPLSSFSLHYVHSIPQTGPNVLLAPQWKREGGKRCLESLHFLCLCP